MAATDRQLLEVPKLELKYTENYTNGNEVRVDLEKEHDIDEDGSEENEDDDEEKHDWLSWIKIVAPHLVLVLATWLYTIVGASVFYSIEQPHEADQKNKSVQKINEIQSNFLEFLWNLTTDININETQFAGVAVVELDRVLEATFKAFEGGVTADDISNNSVTLAWTYYSAVFFSTTVITTIGYGNLVPVTLWGRMFCVCYALLGIPLTLITIADIGKFVSSFIIWLYEMFSKPVDYITELIRAKVNKFKEPSKSTTMQELVAPEGETSVEKETSETSESEESFDMDEEFEGMPVPQSFILFTLLSYTAIGAFLFNQWEGWSFVDAFYFCLITVTTVGFGDLVPTEETYLMFGIVFIFIGLVLATMCIDTVGSHYIRKIHYFGRKIEGAQQVLAMIGGKALTMGDWMKHMKKMQKEYGLTDEEMRKMMLSPDEYINFMQSQQQKRGSKPYNPPDAAIIRYIDQPADPSPRGSNSTARSSARSSARTASSYENINLNRRHVRHIT